MSEHAVKLFYAVRRGRRYAACVSWEPSGLRLDWTLDVMYALHFDSERAAQDCAKAAPRCEVVRFEVVECSS